MDILMLIMKMEALEMIHVNHAIQHVVNVMTNLNWEMILIHVQNVPLLKNQEEILTMANF